MNLSDNLKRLRKENNLSQEELAEKLGVSRQSVSKWESNSAYPEMDKLVQISNMFNIGINELLNKDIREVREKTEAKNTINKYIDDFLSFISKSIDMFLNMKFKQKIKFILEELFVVFILFIVFNIIGTLLNNIYYDLFSFANWNVIHIIRNILSGIYSIMAIFFGVIILLHIYKTRYLDYYEIVDKEDLEKDMEENKKVDIIPDKREKIIIRDPEHSSSRFISGLFNVLVIMFKCFAAFLFVGFSFSLVGFSIIFVCSFLIGKTGLFFIGILLSIISCVVVDIIILDILFNFIIGHKIKFLKLFILFVISLLVLGIGIGCTSIGFTKFEITKDISQSTEKVFQMEDDLVIEHFGDHRIEFIESDNNDVKIVVNYADGSEGIIEKGELDNNNIIHVFVDKDYDGFNYFNKQIDNLNKGVIKDLDYYEVYVYTNKDNIDKLNNNYSELYKKVD